MFRELNAGWTEKQNGYLMKTNALLMLILHRLSEIIVYDGDASFRDYRVNKVTRYISMHYAEKLTIKNLAARIHLHPDYFGRLFKQETGMSLHQYLTRVRVKNAEDLLYNGKYKIDEVAELCGFCDVVYFYKSFKALRGFPPSHCIPRNRNAV
ncbi:MAG: AraC family transcriptional regulator [Treponema sp.]|jgi:YesN/AraC family two-component response regulator|nr:AraC family transcriptional regulator [Treponema sp.]